MKRRFRLVVAALAFGSSLYAGEPLLSVGPDIPVFLTAAATARYDDNVLLESTNKTSDTIFVLMPGVDLHTTGGVSQAGLTFNEQFIRYSSNSNLNSNLASLAGNFAYNGAASKLSAAASYQQMDQSNLSIRSVDETVRRDLTDASVNGSFGLTAKSSIGTGASFDRTRYPKVGYQDSDDWSFPVDLYYAVTPKVDLSLGYRYQQTTVSNSAYNSTGHFLNVGTRGDFTPKLSGQIRVGVNQHRPDHGSSTNQLGLGSTITYLLSPKTSVDLTASNDFTHSAFGTSQKTFSVGSNVQFAFTPQWSATGGASFEATSYLSTPARQDKFWVGNVGLNYALTANSAIQASYLYRKNSSNQSVNFNNNVLSLSASIRF
jgi:outer membrane receptor protein involved in Fe transport